MPPSSPLFEGALLLIWQATWFLAAAALAVAVAVVARRYWREIADPDAPDAMRQLRRRVLAALQGGDWRSVLPLLGEREPEEVLGLVDELAQVVRGEVRRRLAELARALGLERRLLAELASWRAGVRTAAATRLALFEGEEVDRALLGALADTDAEVRLAAAESLAGRPAGRQALATRALADPAFATQAAGRFWHLLARLDEPLFADCFGKLQDAARQRLAVEAAARAGLVRFTDAIGRFCMSPDPSLRRAATTALLELRHRSAFAALERLLLDPEPELRAHALVLVAHAGLRRFAPQVLARLEDPDPLVRARARETALRMGLPLPGEAVSAADTVLSEEPS